MPALEIRHLSKRYGERAAVDDVSFSVDEGELVCVVGPSGCGKTTILRCAAGLLAPNSGRIVIDGHVVFSANPRIAVKTERRGIGLVFQDYALWPHMSVAQHLRFPMESAGVPRAQRDQRVADLLDLVRLNGFADRRPAELSGGQQQRVALARALAARPRLVLMDEPMSNLDARLRQEMRGEIVKMVRDTGVATLYVTHDQAEAMSIGDRIVVLRDGRIVQDGSPAEVYERPADQMLANFLGIGPAIAAIPGPRSGEVVLAGRHSAALTGFDTSQVASVVVPVSAVGISEDRDVWPDGMVLSALVESAAYEGGAWLLSTRLCDTDESLQFRSERPLAKGASVSVRLLCSRLLPFTSQGTLCIREPECPAAFSSYEVSVS